jgi:hypothetical protein
MTARALVSTLVVGLFLGLGLAGCATVEQVETTDVESDSGPGAFGDPAGNEADFELDQQLCWQSIEPGPATGQAAQDAYEACMRAKGWTDADLD